MSSLPSFQRARKPDEKAQRQKAILEAAAALFESEGLEGVSLNAVARRAGIAKSNVYRYFESREAILLALLNEDQATAATSIEAALARLEGKVDAQTVARALAQTIAGIPRFCILQSALSTVLEQNISEEGIAQYKQGVLRVGLRLGNAMRAALPSLRAHAVGPLLRYTHVLIAGLYPLAHPAPAVARVIRAPDFAVFRSDFAQDLEAMLAPLLTSLCAPS